MTTDEFHVRLEELMDKYKLTRYTLAKRSGVAASTIYNLQSKHREPKLETFCKIASGFHMTLDEFAGLTNKEETISLSKTNLLNLMEGFDERDFEILCAYAQALSDSKNEF